MLLKNITKSNDDIFQITFSSVFIIKGTNIEKFSILLSELSKNIFSDFDLKYKLMENDDVKYFFKIILITKEDEYVYNFIRILYKIFNLVDNFNKSHHYFHIDINDFHLALDQKLISKIPLKDYYIQRIIKDISLLKLFGYDDIDFAIEKQLFKDNT